MKHKKQKVGNVPILRFPGFEGEWEEKKLGELLEFKNGINASKEQYGTGVKFINILDILQNSYLTYEKIIGRVNVSKETIKSFAVGYGDILFQRSSETREEVGSANVYLDKEHIATFGGFVIRGKKIGEYDPVFLNNLLKTSWARGSITSKSGGSTRYNISQDVLTSITLHFPNLIEQQKIALLLSHVEERIQTQIKLIQRLETLMLGLREDLFTQKFRFKDEHGNVFPVWESKLLGDVLIKNSERNKEQRYSLVQSVSNKFGFINQDEMFENRKVASTDTSNYFVIKQGCFAYNPSRINVGSLAYKSDNETSIISPLYISFFADQYCLNNQYLLHWFFTQYFIIQMHRSFEGSVRNTLSYEALIKIDINLPSLQEQSKIAGFLTSLSDKIENEKNLLAQYEQQKKYLLQQLFV